MECEIVRFRPRGAPHRGWDIIDFVYPDAFSCHSELVSESQDPAQDRLCECVQDKLLKGLRLCTPSIYPLLKQWATHKLQAKATRLRRTNSVGQAWTKSVSSNTSVSLLPSKTCW
jgi:hypothetical protein